MIQLFWLIVIKIPPYVCRIIKKNSGDTSLCHRYFRFMDYTKKATDYLLVVFLVEVVFLVVVFLVVVFLVVVFLVVVFLAVAVIAGFAA